MIDEDPLVIFNERALPLFVDTHVQIACMAVFSWEKSDQFSYFPIIVQPPNFPNLYISLLTCDEKELKNILQHVFKFNIGKMKYQEIDKFDPLLYDINSNDKTFLYLGKANAKNPHDLSFNLARISQQILNPLGIGIFYSTQFKLAKAESESFKGGKYYQAPFSMDIIDRLLYKPNLIQSPETTQDKDIGIIDAISLMSLQYPLKPLIAPMEASDNLRRRIIFSQITLKNPPSFFISENFSEYNGTIIDPFTWVIVELTRQVQKPTFAVICNKNDKKPGKAEAKNDSLQLKTMKHEQMLNFYPWNPDAKNVIVQFKDKKAAIISPYPGILNVYSDENQLQYSAKLYNLRL